MIEFTIAGLNDRQKMIADLLWQCNTKAQIDALIKNLPNDEMRREANNIVELMILAAVEQCYDGLSPMKEAQQLINKVSK